MVFIKDHPGGVLCEDPGDSLEHLELTSSTATAIIACSVELSFQALNFSLDTKSFHYYFSFMFHSSPLKYEDIRSSTQDHGVLRLSSNLWMYLLLMVSWSITHSYDLKVEPEVQFGLQDMVPRPTMHVIYPFLVISIYGSIVTLEISIQR